MKNRQHTVPGDYLFARTIFRAHVYLQFLCLIVEQMQIELFRPCGRGQSVTAFAFVFLASQSVNGSQTIYNNYINTVLKLYTCRIEQTPTGIERTDRTDRRQWKNVLF